MYTHRYGIKASASEAESQKKLDVKKTHKVASEKLEAHKQEKRKNRFMDILRNGF